MRGIESRGMLLTTQDADGSVRLLRPEVAVTAGIKIS
jgi:tRNA-binding EMAP/Myf-like protein